jgi:hypothetical protein
MNSDIISQITPQVIAIYDNRAAQITTALRQVTAATRGVAADPRTTRGQKPDRRSHTITLELQQAQSVGTFTTTSALTFDVSSGADGFAQRVGITQNARQSVHETGVGFYVDEFATSVGQLEVDVIVAYNTQPDAQIQHFFDLLQTAKVRDPLSSDLPFRLRYHDTFLGTSLIVTQDSIRLELNVERPNMGRLTISATILSDYTSQNIIHPSASTTLGSPNPTQLAATAQASLLSFTNLSGIDQALPTGIVT